ncbi:hypothetical protein [Streptomyces sp. cg35]|uniref:hypothetical protein n=1 Tax=Streptomyces sp. cg35 TaxID=3421650 RepID=UPI003D16B6DE
MRVITEDLHCTAIRITGGDLERIETTARHAAAAGLEVWFSPFPCEMTDEEMLPYFTDGAEWAERLRRDGADVVLVTGCELSLFARGYLPGDTFSDHVPVLAGPDREAALQPLPTKVNAFLGEVVRAVRPVFSGLVSYASCPLDGVDWSPFGIVGLDAFRGVRNAATYRDDLREEFSHGKPVAIMEVAAAPSGERATTAARAGTSPWGRTASPPSPGARRG